jgi:transcriptional regulator with XRE-family HTH domain
MEQISAFADRLKEYMDLHQMTYDDLSKITKVPAQTLNRYVLGQRIPKIDAATEIARKIGVSPLWLQGFNVPSDFGDNESNDISDDIDSVLEKLEAQPEGLMFCGKPMDEETKRLLKLSLEHVKRLAAEMDKAEG